MIQPKKNLTSNSGSRNLILSVKEKRNNTSYLGIPLKYAMYAIFNFLVENYASHRNLIPFGGDWGGMCLYTGQKVGLTKKSDKWL